MHHNRAMQKLNHYKYFLFDADGTMIDTEELVYQSFLYTCRKFGGFEIDKKKVTSLMGIPFVPQIKEYLGDLSDSEMMAIRRDYKNHQDSIYQKYLALFPGIKEGLSALKSRGKKLAVVSSRTEPSLLRYLEETGILPYFDLIVHPELTRKHKPSAEPVEYALKKLRALPEETLFIGDAEFDIKSGRAAGTDTALVSWGPNNVEELESAPHYILQSMEQLI